LAVRERTEQLVRAVAGERADEIEVAIESSLRAEADPDAFDHIVSNLIGNALRYGQPPIAVSAMLQDRHFRLTVEDQGKGVPSDFAPRLFERFTRAGQSEATGAGLGLSIAQAYAHAQGGELLYEDAKPPMARGSSSSYRSLREVQELRDGNSKPNPA
jgi:signal transduction histidine kinase